MQRLKRFFLHEYTLVFVFCLAVIQGSAFSLIDNYDQSANLDCQTYLGIAKFELNQSPIRRYRPIVPLLAGSLNYAAGNVFRKLQPGSFPGDFPLCFSFFIVNNIFVALTGVVIYRYCRLFGVSRFAVLLGLLVMLTCRWTSYIAGTAIVDSLYCLIIALSLLGIEERNSKLIILAIFLGPFAKEAFIFIAPVIFFFSHIPKLRQLLYFLISGLLIFAFRLCYDRYAGFQPISSLAVDMTHVYNVSESLRRLFSFHGIYDLYSDFGLWILLPVSSFMFSTQFWPSIKRNMRLYMLFFMIAVLVHMLLSEFLGRMLYIAMPLLCLVTALGADEMRKKYIYLKK